LGVGDVAAGQAVGAATLAVRVGRLRAHVGQVVRLAAGDHVHSVAGALVELVPEQPGRVDQVGLGGGVPVDPGTPGAALGVDEPVPGGPVRDRGDGSA